VAPVAPAAPVSPVVPFFTAKRWLTCKFKVLPAMVRMIYERCIIYTAGARRRADAAAGHGIT
jgi:hypothetical protein